MERRRDNHRLQDANANATEKKNILKCRNVMRY